VVVEVEVEVGIGEEVGTIITTAIGEEEVVVVGEGEVASIITTTTTTNEEEEEATTKVIIKEEAITIKEEVTEINQGTTTEGTKNEHAFFSLIENSVFIFYRSSLQTLHVTTSRRLYLHTLTLNSLSSIQGTNRQIVRIEVPVLPSNSLPLTLGDLNLAVHELCIKPKSSKLKAHNIGCHSMEEYVVWTQAVEKGVDPPHLHDARELSVEAL
jgi:hypothetical protein